MSETARLVPGKTDIELSAEIRERLKPHLLECCAIMEEARRAGLIVTFNLAPVVCGRYVVKEVGITRPL
jgi:hypothetical protein